MNGLILKDFVNLKKNGKTVVLILIFYAFVSFNSGDASFMGSFATVFFGILFLSTFTYDEQAKWENFAITIPVTKDAIIQAKYAVMLIISIIGGCFGVLGTVLVNLILNKPDILSKSWMPLMATAVLIIFYSIIIPVIIKAGVEKARIAMFLVYMIPVLIGLLAGKLIDMAKIKKPEGLEEFVEALLKYSYIMLPILVLAALGISYAVSIAIYRKKEF